MKRVLGWLTGSDPATALVWAALTLPFFIAMVGLTLDGGLLFADWREMKNVTGAAARAGATQIDQQVYRDSNGATVTLDTAKARATAAQYVGSELPGVQAQVGVQPQRVVVTVSRDVPTDFLRIVGVMTAHISATSPAEARYGIDRASQ